MEELRILRSRLKRLEVARTKLEEAGEALIASEEQYREMSDSAADVILMIDARGDIIHVNRRCEELTGFSGRNLRRFNLQRDLVVPEDQDKIRSVMTDLSRGVSRACEIRLRTKDGQTGPLQGRFSPSLNKKGLFEHGCCVFRDAVEQERTRWARAESELWMRAIFNSLDDAVFVTTPGRVLVDINAAAEKMLGYSREELIGQSPELLHVDREHFDRLGEEFRRSFAAGETARLEFNLRKKNGAVFPTRHTVSMLHNTTGQPLGIVHIIRDLSGQKSAETTLKESQHLVDRILSSTPDLIYIYDLVEQRTIYANHEMARLFGYTPQQIEWMGAAFIPNLLHPEDVGVIAEHHRRFDTAGDDEVLETTYRMRHPDGRWRVLHSRDVLFSRTPEGAARAILGTAHDITEQVQMEQALRASEAKFIKAFHVSPIPMSISTFDDGRFVEVNDRFIDTVGFTREQAIGRTSLELGIFLKADDRRRLLEEVRSKGFARDVECAIGTRRGEKRYCLVSMEPVELDDARYLLTVANDITERKQAEDALRASEEKYRALVETTNTGFAIVDREGRILDANQEFARLAGFQTPREIMGRSVLEWTAEHDLARNAEEVKKCAARGWVRSLEIDYVDAAGRITPIEVNATVLQTPEGPRILTLCRDITERRRAEEQLRNQVEEADRFNRLATGREHRIIELKQRINELSSVAGLASPYKTPHEEPDQPDHDEYTREAKQSARLPSSPALSYDLADLIDLKQMQSLLDSFCDAVGVSSAIIDLDGNVLVGARWQPICTDFHRTCALTAARCVESDTVLAGQLQEGGQFSIYQCRNGLTDAASPIVIEGRHVANVFVGQFLLGSADEAFFRRQAAEFGFDEAAYLAALARVPVVSREKLPAILGFLSSYAGIVATIGLERLREKAAEANLAGRARELNEINQELRRQREAALSLAEDAGEARAAAELAEREIRHSEATLRSIFGAVPVGVGLISNRTMMKVNERLCRITGFREDELIGQNTRMLYWSDADFDFVGTELYRQIRESGTGTVETRWRRKDGRMVNVLISSTPLDPNDLAGGITATALDITDRKRAEEELDRQRAFLRQVIDFNPNLLFVKDAEGRFLLANKPMADAYGTTIEEIIGKTDLEVGTPADKAALYHAIDEEILRSGRDKSIPEERFVLPTGETRYYQTIKRAIVDERGVNVAVLAVASDITERKEAEEALRNAAREWQTTFDAAGDSIWLLDREQRVVRCNKATTTIFGKEADEVVGRSCWEIVHGGSHPIEGCPVVRMRTTLHRESMELQVGDRWLEVVVDPILNERGALCGAVHLVSDITDRKQIDAALRENEERFRQLVENINEVLWLTDWVNRELLYVSPNYEAVYGRPRKSLFENRRSWIEAIHPEDRARVDRDFAQKGELGEYTEAEYRIIRPDGEIRWVRDRSHPIRDVSGRVYRWVGIAEDVTERKRAEAEIQKLNAELEQRVRDRTAQLQAANVQLQTEIVERTLAQMKLAERTRQLETVTNNAPDLIFRVDRNLRYLYVNPRVSEALGLSQEACIGKTSAEMGVPSEIAGLWDAAYAEILATARPKEFAFVYNTSTAGPRHYQARLVPELAENGTVETVLGLSRDVTDLRRSAERLRQIEHLASIGTLATGIAHEINNPIGAMRLAAQNALSYMGEPLDRPALLQCLNDIIEDAQRCGQIIKNVLRFAKDEPLEKNPGDLGELVRRAADITRPLAEERGIVLDWAGAQQEAPPVCLNATAMLQALVNIIRNAIEASPPRGRVCVWLKQIGDVVRVAVQDQGPGLTAEQQRHMFDPFYTTRRQQGGTGLGLSIVHGIIGDHGGSIDVDSRPAHGTTVTITLPLGS